MELWRISDYCDHFTIIVLSLAKNDPPKSDLKKMALGPLDRPHLIILYHNVQDLFRFRARARWKKGHVEENLKRSL